MLYVTDAQMAVYRASAAKRKQQENEQILHRYELAWKLARNAASILQTEFAATQVCVFGSLLQPTLFHTNSDIDLAVWGTDDRQYLRALSRLLSLDPDFSFDLVRMEEVSPTIKRRIEETGTPL